MTYISGLHSGKLSVADRWVMCQCYVDKNGRNKRAKQKKKNDEKLMGC